MKATADFLWVIYEIENALEIEPNEKFDTQQSKWTGGTAYRLESDKLAQSQQAD